MYFERFIRNQKAVHTSIIFEDKEEYPLLISGIENCINSLQKKENPPEWHISTLSRMLNDLKKYHNEENKYFSGAETTALLNDYMPFLVSWFCSDMLMSSLLSKENKEN